MIKRLNKNKNNLRRITEFCMAVSFGLAVVGLVGDGYVELKLRRAPDRPDAVLGYTEPLDYKGSTRFVSNADAKIQAIAHWLMFGFGGFIFCGFILDFQNRSRRL